MRKAYFLQSVDALAEQGAYHAVLWPMFETWHQAVSWMKKRKYQIGACFLQTLGFEEEKKENLLKNLDHFIDQGERLLEDYKNTYNL